MTGANPVSTPMDVATKLIKSINEENKVDARVYQSAVGSLLYLATATRPDISLAVGKAAQFNANPTTAHWTLVKRILRYVGGTADLGLLYTPGGNQELVGYSDSDFAGDINDRKSTSAYTFIKSGALISWRSKKQTVVAQSTAEAEYVALAAAAQEAIWLRRLLEDFGLEQRRPTVLHEDNQAAIAISTNPVNHSRVKHIDTKYHFIRDQVEHGTILLQYCPTEQMVADILTKPLAREHFGQLCSAMGLVPIPSKSGGVSKTGLDFAVCGMARTVSTTGRTKQTL